MAVNPLLGEGCSPEKAEFVVLIEICMDGDGGFTGTAQASISKALMRLLSGVCL